MGNDMLGHDSRCLARGGAFRSAAFAAVSVCLWALAASEPAFAEDASDQSATSLRVEPADVVLRGPDSVQQLAVDASSGASSPRDVTRRARYASSDLRVATVDDAGLITARGDGSGKITLQSNGRSATI